MCCTSVLSMYVFVFLISFAIIWCFSGVKLLYGKDTSEYSIALVGNKGSTYDDSLFDRHAGTNGSGLACAWGWWS